MSSSRASSTPDESLCVQLDAVARLEHGVLHDRRAALRARPESADALPELDRSGAMAEPEADETIHVQDTLLSATR